MPESLNVILEWEDEAATKPLDLIFYTRGTMDSLAEACKQLIDRLSEIGAAPYNNTGIDRASCVRPINSMSPFTFREAIDTQAPVLSDGEAAQLISTYARHAPQKYATTIDADNLLARAYGQFVVALPASDIWHTPVVAATGSVDTSLYHYLTQTLKHGDFVVHVGAHIGVDTVLMASLVGDDGKVVALEGRPASSSYLQRNVQVNRLGAVTDVWLQEAWSENLADASIPAGAWFGPSAYPRSLPRLEGIPDPCGATYLTSTRTVDSLVGSHDVELAVIQSRGHQLRALQGMMASIGAGRVRRILVLALAESLGGKWDDFTQLVSSLIDKGWTMAAVDDQAGRRHSLSVASLEYNRGMAWLELTRPGG